MTHVKRGLKFPSQPQSKYQDKTQNRSATPIQCIRVEKPVHHYKKQPSYINDSLLLKKYVHELELLSQAKCFI